MRDTGQPDTPLVSPQLNLRLVLLFLEDFLGREGQT